MNKNQLQEERDKLNERIKHLNAILLFTEIIDYLKTSPDIETLELCQLDDNSHFAEECLFVNLTGPNYKNWQREPIFSFFTIENLTVHTALKFPLPVSSKGFQVNEKRISFDKNSELGDMLKQYTTPETYTIYLKEWLQSNVALPNSSENSAKQKLKI